MMCGDAPGRGPRAPNLHWIPAVTPRPIKKILVANRGEIAIRVMRAEADGEVAEVLVRPSSQVDAKDLLIVIA